MADTVTTKVLYNSPRKLVVKFLSRSDGTGESNVVKVDKSAYTGPNGLEPSFFLVEKIEYDVSGMEVLISVDNTTDQVLFRLSGGPMSFDYSHIKGISTSGTGDTGDILFSTNGHSAGDAYDVTMHLLKHN